MRPRVPPRAALRHLGRAWGAAWGTGLRRCSGPVSMRGRGWARCPPAAQVPRGAARGGLWDFLQVGVRARVLLWGVSFAAPESQRPDDLVCCVQRQRSGACFAWGRGFRHCCVAVPKSRGWGADFLWLVYVLWARRGVGWGARTLVPRAGIHVCVWASGALPPPSVVTPLRGASEGGRSPSSGCPHPGGCRGPLSTCCGHGCAGMGPSTVPVACMPCEGRLVPGAVPPLAARPRGRVAGLPRPVCPGCGWCGRGGPASAQ